MPLKDYIVYVPSVWYTPYYVRARSEKYAIRKVQRGEGQSSDSAEYERQLEPREWKWLVVPEAEKGRPFT